MGYTQPRIPKMNIITADPVTGYVIQAAIDTASALPDGATYAGIFAISAQLQILAGSAAGTYVNTNTVASPTFTEVV